MFISKRRARMHAYLSDTPAEFYCGSYDEQITDEQANMLLCGDFEGFDESFYESTFEMSLYSEFWEYWEDEFARTFGYDSWDEMPERLQEYIRDDRMTDSTEYTRDLIRNKCRGSGAHVVATVLVEGVDGRDTLVYAPSNYIDREGRMEDDDVKRALYLADTFGIETEATDPHGRAEEVRDKLEVVYGGYDRECLVVIGSVDLLGIYEAQEAPNTISIGPEDADNVLFYEASNGCGNMGAFNATKTVRLRARFRIDGTIGYGIDSCYGFTGSVWRHPLNADYEKPEDPIEKVA